MNSKRFQCSFCCCDSNAFGVPWNNKHFRFVICRACKEEIMDRNAWRVFEGEAFTVFKPTRRRQ